MAFRQQGSCFIVVAGVSSAFALVDLVVILARGAALPLWPGWAELVLSICGLASLFAIALYAGGSAWGMLTDRAESASWPSWRQTGLAVLPVVLAEAVCGWLLVAPVWHKQGPGMRIVWLLGPVALAASAFLARTVLRAPDSRLPRLAGIAACLAAAGFVALDATVLLGQYAPLHVGLLVAALWCGYSATSALVKNPPRMHTGRTLALIALLGAYPAFVLPSAAEAGPVLARQAPFTGKVLSAGRWLADFDGDGFSSLFAGGDCAEFRADINPQAIDIPLNGIDEDCTGRDFQTPVALPPRTKRYPLDGGPYNVVLIIIDALRADHVGAVGYARNTTPNIDRLARHSQVFRRAYSQSPKTANSAPSIVTGRYPSNLVLDYSRPDDASFLAVLDEAHMTLAEHLDQAGYRTVLATSVSAYRRYGFAQGFDRISGRRFADVRKTARRALRKGRQPLFLMVHTVHPHAPYRRHEAYDFGSSTTDLYDGEVAYSDAFIGELLDELAAAKRLQRSIVIVTADHGESLGEMGRRHHVHVHEETAHVPLVMFVPGMEPRVFDRTTELVSLVPTLLELLDLPPEPLVDGPSLAPALFGEEMPVAGAISQRRTDRGVSQTSLVRGNRRLTVSKGGVSLIDVVNDREGRRNLAREEPEVVAEMRQQMALRLQTVEHTLVERAATGKRGLKTLVERAHLFCDPGQLARALKLIHAAGVGDAVDWESFLRRKPVPEVVRELARRPRGAIQPPELRAPRQRPDPRRADSR